jgi:hypothetical protein
MNSIITEWVLTANRSTELSVLIKATIILLLGLTVAGLAVRARLNTMESEEQAILLDRSVIRKMCLQKFGEIERCKIRLGI